MDEPISTGLLIAAPLGVCEGAEEEVRESSQSVSSPTMDGVDVGAGGEGGEAATESSKPNASKAGNNVACG